MKAIEVTIDAKGGVKVEAINFKGPECEKSTRFLEACLGVTKSRQRKPEYMIRLQNPTGQRVKV